jgi:hypothetical protein
LHLTLSAVGVQSRVPLFTLDVDEQGHWTYESRAVERAAGILTQGDRAQLKNLCEEIDWDLETLNSPVSADDGTLFKLEVVSENGDRRLYQSSEALNHRSWQFRDLVHFLRHNVATNAAPMASFMEAPREQPPLV